MIRGPDFIIIGAMKCATSTLHEQLARQKGVFMSTPKEPNFFSDDSQWLRGTDWYAGLFENAPPGALCGESSTHYTKLPTYPSTIARMKRTLPDSVRFIYIMRHPVDRLVSHYIHEWTQRVISCPIQKAVREHSELIAYSRYAMQIEPFLDCFGPERVLPIFFERLARHPQTELERVCEFIGLPTLPQWHDDLGEQNASNQRLRQCAWRDALINAPVLKQLRRALVPQAVRDWVKGFWTMSHRPELGESDIRRLNDEFDKDLALLGKWLGLDLNCNSYTDIAAQTSATWAPGKKASAA